MEKKKGGGDCVEWLNRNGRSPMDRRLRRTQCYKQLKKLKPINRSSQVLEKNMVKIIWETMATRVMEQWLSENASEMEINMGENRGK